MSDSAIYHKSRIAADVMRVSRYLSDDHGSSSRSADTMKAGRAKATARKVVRATRERSYKRRSPKEIGHQYVPFLYEEKGRLCLKLKC
jgi:hypothetical protein